MIKILARKCQLQRLFIIQTWIHLSGVGFTQISFLQRARTTQTFSDVFTGQFQVHATEVLSTVVAGKVVYSVEDKAKIIDFYGTN